MKPLKDRFKDLLEELILFSMCLQLLRRPWNFCTHMGWGFISGADNSCWILSRWGVVALDNKINIQDVNNSDTNCSHLFRVAVVPAEVHGRKHILCTLAKGIGVLEMVWVYCLDLFEQCPARILRHSGAGNNQRITAHVDNLQHLSVYPVQ